MTDPKRIHDALEQIAGEAVPENTDLWGQIRARASSQQHTIPVRVHPTRPAFRPNMPGLRLAGAALALLLCVVIGYGMVRSLLNPGMPPVIALLTTPFNTSSPSPAANPSAVAQAVQATVTAFQPEASQPAQATVPQNTATPSEPVTVPFEPTETAATQPETTQAAPVEDPTEAAPEVEATPTGGSHPTLPVITGLGVENLGEQTLNGVTVTLDWANMDENYLFFQYTVHGLPEEEGLDLRGAARVTGVTIHSSKAELTGTEPVDQSIISMDGAVVIRETREVQHTARPGETVDFSIDITAGGVTLPRTITGSDGSTTSVEGMELPLAGEFAFTARVPFHPALRLEPNQVSEINGVRVELNWMRVSHYATDIGVCFNVPVSGDWQMEGTTTLQIGSAAPATIVEQGIDLSQPGSDPTMSPLRRCLHASFATLYDGAPTTATFTIPALSTPVDFVKNFEEARKILAPQGIEIEKVAVESGFEIRITRRPESMSEEEANRRLFEAARQVKEGPWVFTIPVPGR